MIPVLQTTVIIALLYSRQHPKAVSDTCLYEEMGKEERPPNCTKDVKGRASIFPKAGFLVFPPRSVGCHLSHASILFCQVLLPTLPWSGSPRPLPALLQHPVQSIRTERPRLSHHQRQGPGKPPGISVEEGTEAFPAGVGRASAYPGNLDVV